MWSDSIFEGLGNQRGTFSQKKDNEGIETKRHPYLVDEWVRAKK